MAKGILGAIENLGKGVGKAAKTDALAAWDAAGTTGDAIVGALDPMHPVLAKMAGEGATTKAPVAPTYRAEDMINSVWTGLNPAQVQRVKDLLKQQGIDETVNVHAYRAALNALNASIPQLQQYSKDAAIFGGGSGSYDIGALAQELTKLDAPYIAQENQSADAYAKMMAPLIAKMPANMQPLEQAMTGTEVQGMKNLGVAQLLQAQAQPIANALSTYNKLGRGINTTQLRDALLGIGTGATSALPPLGAIPKTS